MDAKKLQDKVKQFQQGNKDDIDYTIDRADKRMRADIQQEIAEAKFYHVIIHKINDFLGKIFGWKRRG